MNRSIEEMSMNAWPALNTHHYDGWVLRYAQGYTKRANSIYPLYESRKEFTEKLAYCEAYYNKLMIPTTFKLHDGEELHVLDNFLEDQGYHVLTPTDVMTKNLRDVEINDIINYRVVHGYSEEWANVYGDTICGDDTSERAVLVRSIQKTMLQSIIPAAFYIFVEEHGQVVASGSGVVEDGTLGVFNVVVQSDYRGVGYGKLAMLAILKEGKALGAENSYLQVVCNNEVAVNLYKSLGYKKVYRYWYRRKDEHTYD